MAAKSTENNAAETETVEETKVPHQADKPKLEVIEGEKVPFAVKAKSILTNKKVLAGVSSVALIAAGVFVVRKRNEDVSEDEVTSD
jgi:hypothetical protein